MLRVVQSNETERLIEVLAARLPRGPFQETTLIVPNRAKERFVETSLARHRKVLANIRFTRLETWLSARWEASLARAGTPHRILGARELEVRLLEVLSREALRCAPSSEHADELDPVRRYLAADAGDRRAQDVRIAELAARLSQLFTEYTFSRPSWVRAWMEGEAAEPDASPLERWQRALYREARACTSEGAAVISVAEVLEMDAAWDACEPVVVFGLSYVAEAFQRALGKLAERVDVDVYAINPCREFWADAETPHEARRRMRGGDAMRDAGLDAEDNALLQAWGRPGREHVAVLDEMAGFSAEDAFVNPTEARPLPSLLARIQEGIVERRPTSAGPSDASVVVLPCPSVRREVECVKQLIWGLVAAHAHDVSPLRFSEIAVLVQSQSRDLYLPHMESVFGESTFDAAHHLPWSAQDLQLGARSRVAEAVLRLLRVLRTAPTRRELLGLASHALVHRGFEEAEPAAWARMLRDAGVVRGADERDLEGTYVDAASGVGGVLHFDQGLTRLALLAAGQVEEDMPSELRVGETMDLVRFMRSVLADTRAIAKSELTLRAWGALLAKLARAYVHPESRGEQAELERCVEALKGIGSHAMKGPLFGPEVPFTLAEREVESIPAVRGDPQSLGVVVASLLPMRAIPFRVVFVLGLGEGLFPMQRTEGGLDLRSKHRRAGDVSPEERDRYAFLEALLSVRDRLILSYVARDGETGDALQPATVIHELREAAGGLVTSTPPQRRDRAADGAWLHAVDASAAFQAAALAALPESVREESARARGDRERVHFRDYEVESEAWASFTKEDPARATFAIPALPEMQPVYPIRANLSVLRKFLRCPIQGKGELTLRMHGDDEGFLGDEEPLDAGALITTRVAEDALFAILAAPSEARMGTTEAVERVTHRLVRQGDFPLGVLGVAPAQRAQGQLEAWLSSLAEARGTKNTRALPLRLGGVTRLGEHAQETHAVRPALTLLAPLQKDAAQASWLIEGRTRAFVMEGERATDVLALVSGKQGGERGQIARLEALLMAYLDHVVLAALGEENVVRRALLLTHDGPYASMLSGITRANASRWLGTLLTDLTRERDVGYMPIEAVLLEEELFRRGDTKLAERLMKSTERVRTKYEGGASRYGPIRDAVRFEAPDPKELLQIAGRRFGLFFQQARPPVRVSQDAALGGLLR